MTMEVPTKPAGAAQEEDFEWGLVDGKWTKITKENANGRKCEGCNHDCPCKCKCCKPFCCTNTHAGDKKQ